MLVICSSIIKLKYVRGIYLVSSRDRERERENNLPSRNCRNNSSKGISEYVNIYVIRSPYYDNLE